MGHLTKCPEDPSSFSPGSAKAPNGEAAALNVPGSNVPDGKALPASRNPAAGTSGDLAVIDTDHDETGL